MEKKSNNYLSVHATILDQIKSLMTQEEIAMLFKKKCNSNDKIISEIMPSDENFFNIFFYCITRYPRSNHEISIIVKYLNTLDSFMNVLKKSNCSTKELTFTIASFIKYEYLKKDYMLFRLGEKGDKYYIILKGSVSIMIAKDIKIDLTEDEFLKFIVKLKATNEQEILYKTLLHNSQVFPAVYENFYQKPLEKNRVSKQITTRNSLQTKSISTKETEEYPNISVEDYINTNLPVINEKDKKERKSATIFRYFNVVTLKAGDTFGEVALISSSQKRTGTVISLEDCHLGTLDKKGYEQCLKESMYREKINDINFILSNHIFKGMARDTFMTKFYNFFVRMKVSRGDRIINEGNDPGSLYLIKEGEFEISVHTNICGIKDICRTLGDHSKEAIFEEYNMKKNLNLRKFLNDKKTHKLAIVRERDVIGMDYMIHENKYAFTALCLKNNSEVFKLDSEMLNRMIENDESVEIHSKSYLKRKKAFYLKRLSDIKETLINFYNKNQNVNINLREKNNSLMPSLKDSDRFLETQIILTSSSKKKKIINKKMTNFNLIFSKNMFSSSNNEKELNTISTPFMSDRKYKLTSSKYLEILPTKTSLNFRKLTSNKDSDDKLKLIFPKLGYKDSSNNIPKVLTRNISNNNNKTRESEEGGTILVKSQNTHSSMLDSIEDKQKSLLEYKKINIEQRRKNIKLNAKMRLTSNDISCIENSSLFKHKSSLGFDVKKVLISSFMTNESNEQRPPNKYNYVDCLAIDNIYRNYINQTEIKKENLCNQIQIGRAKHIFEKTKKSKLRQLSNMFDFSKEVQKKKDKYLEERKKVAYHFKKPSTSLAKISVKSLNKYSSYN